MNRTVWMECMDMECILLITPMGIYLTPIEPAYIMEIMLRIGKNSIGLMSNFNKIILT